MVLADFPLTSNGKVDRRALPAPEYARPQLGEAFPFQGPRDAVETELVEIWERALGVRPIGITDDFFELGGHSLLAANVFGEIAKRYGRDLPLATLFRQPTIAELATVLRSEAAQASWSPLVSIRATGSKPPFFCLHSAGGNVLEYYPLAKHLGPDQPFYALQSEGLDGGPAEPSRLEDMAARYLGAIRTVQPRGPYRLGGFCFGGMLAFEVAQQLLAIGQDVTLVAMIENPTGDYGCSLPGTTPLQRQMHRAGQRVLLELGNLGPLDQRAKLAYAVQRARRLLSLGGVGVERLVHPLLERTRLGRQLSRAAAFEELIAAHGRAYSQYVPHSYPGRVVVFRASEQAWGVAPDPAMGWTGLLPDEPEVRVVPGQHKNILKEPWVTALADQLQACLDAPATTRQRSSSELELVTSDTGHLPHETFTSAQPDRDVHLRVC
jgi:thioesterase domain-containing protein